MIQGFDRNLQVLTASAFQEVYRRAAALNIADPLARTLVRLLLGTAVELTSSTDSTFGIPEELKAYAKLDDAAILVGQGDYFEIWAPEQWSQQQIELEDVERNASRFTALTVATR